MHSNRSTTSTEATPPAANSNLEDALNRIATSLQNLIDEQRRLHLQLGQSFVTAHQQQRAESQEISRRLDDLLHQRASTTDPSTSGPAWTDTRPALFTPAPAIPRFRTKTEKHPVKFLDELDIYFRKMGIPPHGKLDVVYEALEGEAQDWACIFRVTWTSFEDFRSNFLQSFWSESEQTTLRRKITTHRWQAGHRSMEGHFTHYLGQARMLTTPIADDMLVVELMKHFSPNIQSLWILHPEKTATAAAEFLRQQDSILASQRNHNYIPPNKRFRLDRRHANTPPLGTQGSTGNALRSGH